MGGPGGAEELEGIRLAAVVPAPPPAASRVRAHATRVEGGSHPAARQGDQEEAGPRGRRDSGQTVTLSRVDG